MKSKIDPSRTTRRGVVTITLKSEPLELEIDERKLAQGPAEATAEAIGRDIRAIGAGVAKATNTYRSKARKAHANGAPWAANRYGGKPPGAGSRMFNDSGALADVRAERSPTGFAITTGREMDAPGADAELERLVPVIGDPRADKRVDAAIEGAIDLLLSPRR